LKTHANKSPIYQRGQQEAGRGRLPCRLSTRDGGDVQEVEQKKSKTENTQKEKMEEGMGLPSCEAELQM